MVFSEKTKMAFADYTDFRRFNPFKSDNLWLNILDVYFFSLEIANCLITFLFLPYV